MICILTFDENKEVVGWIIGPDIHEMRRAADAIGESELAAASHARPWSANLGAKTQLFA